jgi:hypothetical protein
MNLNRAVGVFTGKFCFRQKREGGGKENPVANAGGRDIIVSGFPWVSAPRNENDIRECEPFA